jgi:hypothetical protein
MAIELTYRRLKKAKWARLQKDREKAKSFLFSLPGIDFDNLASFSSDPQSNPAARAKLIAALRKAKKDPTRVELDKDWHALHFLLSGDPSMGSEHLAEDPLHNTVLGGHPTDFEGVRILENSDVGEIARALAKISVKKLRGRFSATTFNDEEIYPFPRPGGWTRREVESVFKIYPKLVKFFKDAASAREIVLICFG